MCVISSTFQCYSDPLVTVLLFTLHRPFFKIASDIFLGVASANIGDHSTSVQRLLSKVCTNTQAVLDPIRAVFLSYACTCMYVCMYHLLFIL